MASLLWTVLLVCLAAPCVKAADKALGVACTLGTDTCTDTGAACEGSLCVIIQQKVGRACIPSSSPQAVTACGDEATTFLECSTDKCACKSGYTGNSGESCTANTGSACTTISGCTANNAVCDAADDKCRLKIDEVCNTNTNTLNCITNAGCTGSTNTKCECAADFTANTNKDKCEANLGKTCTADTGCTDANAVCDTTANQCRLKVDETCTGNLDKCITNAGCTGSTNTKCACSTGYIANTAKDSCALIDPLKVGKTCTPGTSSETDSFCGAPATTFLECKTGTTECACKSGYSGDKGGTCSKKSGAAGLVGSLVTVLLAAILHVFMRD